MAVDRARDDGTCLALGVAVLWAAGSAWVQRGSRALVLNPLTGRINKGRPGEWEPWEPDEPMLLTGVPCPLCKRELAVTLRDPKRPDLATVECGGAGEGICDPDDEARPVLRRAWKRAVDVAVAAATPQSHPWAFPTR